MTMPVEPCQWCAVPTARWCGTRPCCWECHIQRCVAHGVSRGKPGRVRQDHGPDQHDLTCIACGATWVGPAWEPCDWCRWENEPTVPRIEFVAGVLECDRCGAIRKMDANWYELTVHGAAEVDEGHPEFRSCNGRMRRITRNRALHLLAEEVSDGED